MPLDFVYEKESNKYLLDEVYNTDEKIVDKIRSGKGDPDIYHGNLFLHIDSIFSETENCHCSH